MTNKSIDQTINRSMDQSNYQSINTVFTKNSQLTEKLKFSSFPPQNFFRPNPVQKLVSIGNREILCCGSSDEMLDQKRFWLARKSADSLHSNTQPGANMATDMSCCRITSKAAAVFQPPPPRQPRPKTSTPTNTSYRRNGPAVFFAMAKSFSFQL